MPQSLPHKINTHGVVQLVNVVVDFKEDGFFVFESFDHLQNQVYRRFEEDLHVVPSTFFTAIKQSALLFAGLEYSMYDNVYKMAMSHQLDVFMERKSIYEQIDLTTKLPENHNNE